MKTGNKGYTLFELVVSIAIFAMVMVGIIALMRSSSVFYLGGQTNVRLQEEAQIALNQIEDLLIDTDNYVNEDVSTDGARRYSVYRADGTYGIKQSGDQLFYKKLESGTMGDEAGWVLMAECVDNFKIEGIDYHGSGERASGDNRVAVRLDMSNGKYEYVARRDVYFRNAIENMTPFTQPEGTGTATPEGGSEYAFTYVVKRGEELNLFVEFDIIRDATLESSTDSLAAESYYTLNGSQNGQTGITEYIIQTGAELEEIDSSTPDDTDGIIFVEGYNSKNNLVKVRLMTEEVGWIEPVPLFYIEPTNPQNDGSPVWVEFKGVDLRGAANGTYKMEIYNDSNNDGTLASGELERETGWRNFGTSGRITDEPVTHFNCKPCENSGFLKIFQTNEAGGANTISYVSAPRYLKVYFSFSINEEPVEGDVVFRLRAQGTSIGN